MKLLLENWRIYLKEAEKIIPAGNITFIAGKSPKGFNIARGKRDIARGGYALEALLDYWTKRGVSEDVAQYYRDAFKYLEQKNIPNGIWIDVEYEPSTKELKYYSRGLPYIREGVDPYSATDYAKSPEIEEEDDEYATPFEYDDSDDITRERYFGAHPDKLPCIQDLRSSSDVFPPSFYQCMEASGYKKIGAGSFRAVFAVPNEPNLVLKVVGPTNSKPVEKRRSMKMNQQEAEGRFQTTSDLAPKVYDSAKDYLWILSENVTPIESWEEMQKFFPIWKSEDPNDFVHYFHDLIAPDRNDADVIQAIDRRIAYVDNGEDLIKDPLILDIRDLLAKHHLPAWDIRPHNVGYVTRNGEKQFVILDPGFGLGKETGTLKDKHAQKKFPVRRALAATMPAKKQN